ARWVSEPCVETPTRNERTLMKRLPQRALALSGRLKRRALNYRVLGPLEVRDGEESLPLAGAKQRALLALLLVHANHVLSRDRLIDELWGEEPPETAVQSLQVYVSRLRELLAAARLLTRPPGYLLEVAPDE